MHSLAVGNIIEMNQALPQTVCCNQHRFPIIQVANHLMHFYPQQSVLFLKAPQGAIVIAQLNNVNIQSRDLIINARNITLAASESLTLIGQPIRLN